MSYVFEVSALNSRGEKIVKKQTFTKGEKVASVPVDPQYHVCAFHVTDVSGVIYPALATLMSHAGGKIDLNAGAARSSNGDLFILEANQKKDKDGKIESQVFDLYEAVSAK